MVARPSHTQSCAFWVVSRGLRKRGVGLMGEACTPAVTPSSIGLNLEA